MKKYTTILLILMMSCRMSTDEHVMFDTNVHYIVVWKYQVKSENLEEFEFEYGTKGTWCTLFNTSDMYKGSFLYKNDEKVNSYLLVDTWVDKKAYDDFKTANEDKYRELGSKFEYLYESEEKVGGCNLLDQGK